MIRSIKFLLFLVYVAISLTSRAADMGAMDNMDNMDNMKPATQKAHSVGIVKAIDTKNSTLTLSHGPIKEINWPAMTMQFKVADPMLLNGITVGKKVGFKFQTQGMSATITSLKLMN